MTERETLQERSGVKKLLVFFHNGASKVFPLVAPILFLGVMLLGCTASQPLSTSTQKLAYASIPGQGRDTSFRSIVVRNGDQIKLRSLEYPEIDTTVTVNDEGTVSLRVLGTFQVTGRTKSELQTLLTERIARYVRTKFNLSIQIVNATLQNVSILGAVARQGNLPAQSEASLLHFLAAAGGPTEDADLRSLKIYRYEDSDFPIEIDLAHILENGEINKLPMVSPGDLVYVPKQENFVREISGYLRDAVYLFTVFTIVR